MFKVGDKVVISGGRAGREGDTDFIAQDGGYWWHGIVEDPDFKVKGWTRQLIRVRYGKRCGNFFTGQVHTEADAMKRLNRKDVFQILAERRTPAQKKVARYSFMSFEKIEARLQGLQRQIQFAFLTERRNVELVNEYNALLDVYRRRTRQGI